LGNTLILTVQEGKISMENMNSIIWLIEDYTQTSSLLNCCEDIGYDDDDYSQLMDLMYMTPVSKRYIIEKHVSPV
jgi:hypothetical protein